MMQRLLVWLMTDMACFTLAIAIIGLDASLPPWLPPPRRVALAFLALGSTIILLGVVVEAVVPFLCWRFGAHGRCERAIRRRIRLANDSLKAPA